MKKLIVVAVLLSVIGVGIWFALRNNTSEVKYLTEKVTRGDIVASVTASGTVNAVTTVLVGTQVSGTISELFVDYNAPVKKDQLIARIDPSIFEGQVEQSRANLLAAQANLEKATVALKDAGRTLSRNRDLFSKGLIARSDLDAAETQHETAETQVGSARAQLRQAEAALRISETNLRYTKIISPVDGIVVSRNVDVGQTVAASFQTPTLFTIAQDLTKMQINTSVDEADIGRVRGGQEVEFTVDAYPEMTFTGKVGQVRIAPITVQNVVTYDVIITVSNPDLRLKPGMTANVSIITDEKKDILRIPNSALRFKPAEKEVAGRLQKGSGVWVLQAGKPKRITVSLGIGDGSFTELVSGEIAEGQEVIIDSSAKKKEQSPSGPRMF